MDNPDIRYMTSQGKVVGEYDRKNGKITLYPGAKVKDVVHEYAHGLWQFAEQEAKEGRTTLRDKFHKIAKSAPTAVKKAVGEAYKLQGPSVIMEECFTHELARKSEQNQEFAKAIKTASGKSWYNRAWRTIKDTWGGIARKMGYGKADIDKMEKMNAHESAEYILKQMAQGKHFGDIDPTPDGGGKVRLPNGKEIDKSLESLYKGENGKLQNTKYSPFLKKMKGDGSISAQLDSTLDNLFSGKDVSDEDIEATPEWKEAHQRADAIEDKIEKEYGVRSTHEIKTPERKQMRRNILKAALTPTITKTVPVEGLGVDFETNEGLKDGESYDVEKGKKVFLTIGFPAAGKSTTFANPLAKKYKARLCDSDTIKKVLPEFANGYGGNAVHEESTALNEAILREAVKRGENIVYPILGYDGEKLKKTIKNFKDKGYKVGLCYKDMPIHMARGRLLNRFLQKGRYLPLKCISKAEQGLKTSFDEVKDMADTYVRTTNDSAYGGKERVIESKGEILDFE
jgi:hypothetical protein